MVINRAFILFIILCVALCLGDCSRHSAPAVRGQDNVAEAVLQPVVVLKPAPVAHVMTPTKPLGSSVPQFRLVGIATGSNGRYALVEDEAGVGYTLKVGSRLGQSEKIVKSIGMDDIILMQDHKLERIRLGE